MVRLKILRTIDWILTCSTYRCSIKSLPISNSTQTKHWFGIWSLHLGVLSQGNLSPCLFCGWTGPCFSLPHLLVMTKSSPWKIAVFGSKSSINRPCSSIFHIANSQITGEYPHTHTRSSTASSATNEPFCPGHGAIHKVRRQTTQPLGMKSWPRSHWYEYIYIYINPET